MGDGEDRGESRGGKNKINDAIVGNVSRLNPLYEKKTILGDRERFLYSAVMSPVT